MTPRHDLSPIDCPPSAAWVPAFLLGIGVAVLGSFVWVAGLAGQGPQTTLLHPLACVGHGLTATVLALLAGSWLRFRRIRSASAGESSALVHAQTLAARTGWLGPGRVAALPNGEPAVEDLELRYRECAAAWSEVLERRWRFYFALAAAPVVPGLLVGLWNLSSAPPPLPPYRDLFVPLMATTLEALFVCLAAVWLRLRWDHLLHEWPRRILAGVERTVKTPSSSNGPLPLPQHTGSKPDDRVFTTSTATANTNGPGSEPTSFGSPPGSSVVVPPSPPPSPPGPNVNEWQSEDADPEGR